GGGAGRKPGMGLFRDSDRAEDRDGGGLPDRPQGSRGGIAPILCIASPSVATVGRTASSPVILKILTIVGWVATSTISPPCCRTRFWLSVSTFRAVLST